MGPTIIAYYEAILRQTPTPAQIDQWDAFLTEADDLEEALADFATALCLQADDVRSILRLYQAIFDRMSDSGGLTFWTNRFREVQEDNPGLSYRDALIETIGQWLESDEYIARFGDNLSDEDFLSLLYLNILGRPADQEGYNFWLAVLKSGALTREQLIVEFTESDEFKADVDDEANGLLKAAAAIDSPTAVDDLPYEFPGGDPYTGELGNEAPIDILIGTEVAEDATNGTAVTDGTLTAVDPDGGETFTWSIDDPSGAFGLDDPTAQQPNIIVVDASKLDHETADVMTVTITVTDSDGNEFSKEVDIDIVDINEAPYNLDLSNMTIDEQDGSLSNPGVGGLVVGILTSDDVDDGDTATYSIVSQSVANAFEIVGDELRVLDASAIDSEVGVTSIDVEIQVEDSGGLTEVKTFTIDVTPIIDEDPTDILPDELDVSATLPVGLTLTDLVAVDPDTTPDSHTFVITNDPTDQGLGGAFAMDITGTKLVLADPTKLSSTVLLDNGPVDTDGLVNGLVVFELDVLATDSNGNTYPDKIKVTVDQNGLVIPFTDTIVEVLDGSEGDDVFTANAGVGIDGPVPFFQQTANAGDIANGMGGDDLFVLTKADNAGPDGAVLVSGVTLNDIEGALLINEDQSPAPVLGDPDWPGPPGPEPFDFLSNVDVCAPCINLPFIAPVFDDEMIFDASLAAELDHVAMGQSRASVGIWDLQDDFWLAAPGDENDLGPVWDIFDMTANYAWLDSDPQSKLAGEEIDELIVTLDEVRLNELRITENAAGNEPGFGPREEQLGTISLKASGVPSIIGSINNGWQGGPTLPSWLPFPAWGPALGTTTHTLNIEVSDLTSSRPSDVMPDMAGTVAAANTAAIDFFAGMADGLGNGLLGLQTVNITPPTVNGVQQPAGDVFLIFGDMANDNDTDQNGFSLEVYDDAGNSFFFFEEGGFGLGDDPDLGGPLFASAVKVDGGDGFDTLGVFASDLDSNGEIWNVERIKILESVGATSATTIWLTAVQDNELQEVIFAGGVHGDLRVFDIPNNPDATQNPAELCDDFGTPGVQLIFDQCCPPKNGNLPDDFDILLDGEGFDARVDTIWKVDPGVNDQRIDNFNVNHIKTLLINVVDCDPNTAGLFEVNHLGSSDNRLETLLLTDDGNAGTTRILNDNWRHDPLTAWDAGGNNFQFSNTFARLESSLIDLTLIKGTDGVRNQELLEFDGPMLADLKFWTVFEEWGADDNPTTTRPNGETGIATDASKIMDELVVSDDGVTADLGEGNDMITGNRITADGVTPGLLGEDFIRGNGGNDLIFGAAGNDQIEGGTGDDELQGEEGDDCLFGDEGDDLILAGSGNDYADGGANDDIIFGGDGEDNLRGGTGDDVLCGDDDDDCLHGEEGNDLLIGGQGDDFLDAGSDGVDMLVGDYGCDPCYAHVTIADDDLEECDVFEIGIDTTGDGVADTFFTSEVGTPLHTPPGNVPANAAAIAADLEDQIQDWIDGLLDADCWDVTVDGPVVTICCQATPTLTS